MALHSDGNGDADAGQNVTTVVFFRWSGMARFGAAAGSIAMPAQAGERAQWCLSVCFGRVFLMGCSGGLHAAGRFFTGAAAAGASMASGGKR